MKLTEILKAEGWTDADIAAAPQKLLDTLEKSYGALATERDTALADEKKMRDWVEKEANPRIATLESKAQDAALKAANLQAQVDIAKEYGYFSSPEAEARAQAEADRAKAEADKLDTSKKYVGWDDIGKLIEAEGQAIAMGQNIALEYQKLTGQSLIDYETDINGRRWYGLEALREEAKVNRAPDLKSFVEKKFDFAGKRQAIRDKRQQEHDDAMRREGAEVKARELSERYDNPAMRFAQPSRSSLIPPKPADGKMPWEKTAAERHARVVQNALDTEMKRTDRVQ